MAFTDLYLIDVRHSKLLALKESILDETPDTHIEISTWADKYLEDMDVIVTATFAGGGKSVIDIMKVKPGVLSRMRRGPGPERRRCSQTPGCAGD
ncbi:MAG: hypothetical protein R2874_09050 [Desulfobacterales bacterium]